MSPGSTMAAGDVSGAAHRGRAFISDLRRAALYPRIRHDAAAAK
jgi:hypothetical protein